MVRERVPEELKSKIHVFNPFFWTKLNQKVTTDSIRSLQRESPSKAVAAGEARMIIRHRQVKQWSKNVDLFDMDFIIFPINESAHWMLIIVCFPGKVETDYAPSYFIKKEEMDRALGRVRKEEEQGGILNGMKEPKEEAGERKAPRSSKTVYNRHPAIILFDSLNLNPRDK